MCDKNVYRLPLGGLQNIDKRVTLVEHPSLHIIYVGDKEGILSLRINDRDVTLGEHDAERDHATVLGEYEFAGKFASNEFFFFTLRLLSPSGSDAGAFGTETRNYREGEAFTLDFIESGGTGETWQLKLPVEIEPLQNAYIPHCVETDEDDQGPGCVNTHRFTLRGTGKGKCSILAFYNKPWDITRPMAYKKTREYKVMIL